MHRDTQRAAAIDADMLIVNLGEVAMVVAAWLGDDLVDIVADERAYDGNEPHYVSFAVSMLRKLNFKLERYERFLEEYEIRPPWLKY